MFKEITHIKTNKKDLRNFGIIFGIIFLIITVFLFYAREESFQIFLYFSVFFIGIGIILPTILKPIYIPWMMLGVILSWLMTRLILSLLFYVIITPIGLILRALSKDFLELKRQSFQGSYWNHRESNGEKNQNYEKQF